MLNVVVNYVKAHIPRPCEIWWSEISNVQLELKTQHERIMISHIQNVEGTLFWKVKTGL